mgnify:CR=1 FL=1
MAVVNDDDGDGDGDDDLGRRKKRGKRQKDDCLSMQILLFLPSNIVYFFIQKYNNFYTTSNLVSEIEISNPLCATWQRAWQNTIEHTKPNFLCLLAKLIAQFCWRDSTQKTLFLCSSFCNFPLFWFLIIFFLIFFSSYSISHFAIMSQSSESTPLTSGTHTTPLPKLYFTVHSSALFVSSHCLELIKKDSLYY